MDKILSSILCLLIASSAVAETVYKKTNPDGSVTFTDRESVDSEEIKLNKTQTYKAPRISAPPLATKKLSPATNYTLNIVQPNNGANFINTDTVPVLVALTPELKSGSGHQIRYQLAEQTVFSKSTSYTFSKVFRGTHVLKVTVVDKQGDAVSSTATTTFYVKRFFRK